MNITPPVVNYYLARNVTFHKTEKRVIRNCFSEIGAYRVWKNKVIAQ